MKLEITEGNWEIYKFMELNTFLKIRCIKKGITKEIKYLEIHKDENTACQNLQNTAKKC